jgi:hypothetical protein
MDIAIDTSKTFNAGFLDAKGNPALVDGVPVWVLDPTDLGTLAVAADGKSAVFTAASTIKTGVLRVSADADLGPGVTTISGQLDINLVSGQAVTIVITPA